jgi:general secretion pathway protein C
MQAWLTRILNGGHRLARDQSPRLVSGILAPLIVLEAARIILPLLPSPAYASVPASRPPPPRVSGVDAQTIVQRHLFGVALDDSVADSGGPLPTTANLILQGTIAASDPRRGFAIVTADGPAQVYKVGDELGGATLDSVYLDRVMLKRGSRLEILVLPRLLASRGDGPPPSPVATVDDAPGPRRAAPKSMGDLMGVDPATSEDSGAFEGFRLRPGRTGAAFMRAGLRNGDIMTAVNGTPLANQNQQTSQEIVNTMMASDHAVVSVLRNGKPVDVSVDLGR